MNVLQSSGITLLPYEKCLRYGAQALTDEELLAVLIRSGTKDVNCLEVAKEILKRSGSLGILGLKHLNHNDYKSIKGIGDVKEIMLQCVG